MESSREARAERLERYREYLRVLAAAGLSPRLRARVDASDIVQQTLIEACDSLEGTEGTAIQAELGWLRKILARNLADAGREHHRRMRDVARERSLEDELQRSSLHLERLVATSDVRPSARLSSEERALSIARAMTALSDQEYEVLILQHWHGKPFTEIAEVLGIDRFAVARVARRALLKLKKELADAS